MKMKAAQAMVEIMVKEGITTAFGIPGAAINPVYQYMEGAPNEHFTMRLEEACVHAAISAPSTSPLWPSALPAPAPPTSSPVCTLPTSTPCPSSAW